MENKLREYAALLVQVGLNVQPGQTLVIASPVECAFFARMCASAAYDAGCREVVMNWRDDYLTREKYLRADSAVFDEVPAWRSHFFNDYANEGAAYLSIAAEDPENLLGVDPDRMVRSQRAGGKALGDFYRLQMSSGFPWCIASIPIPSWAKRVFPECGEAEAMDKLWEAIFHTMRITGDGKSAQRWQQHLAKLDERREKMNALRFKTLRYTNALGTDLTVELPEGHIWESGGDTTVKGQVFVANMPTEELFTAPLRTGINGVVYSAMPLVHDGNIIDEFCFVIREGKIVEARAKQGEDCLKAAISVDEGASYFGEVALVPYDSPISNLKILFYNTLFDENASCHLAFGEAYPCIEGGRDMDKEQLKAAGLNDSITHVDFMVGTADLQIVGVTQDGREIPVFVNGNFSDAL
ncbi:MAG: aminopeptidase [Oscillospiraceae bacterium]|nr:aminopeptidase [Oscillospiraceae bacterium]